MPKRLVIAIDCDDVLIETGPFVAKRYNKAYGTALTLADFYQDDPAPWGVDDIDAASERFHMIMMDSRHLKPSRFTVDTIRRLAARHELHLVTGRNQALLEATSAFADTYFKGCFTSIELTDMYDAARRRSKGQICKQIGADLLVDDHPTHIRSVIDEAGLKEVIVFGTYPWNEGTLPGGAVRCMDWGEAEKEIERIAAK